MARLKDLERAKAAHKAVESQLSSEKAGEYRQHLQQLPARILASGLGQTVAFMVAKQSEPHLTIARQLAGFVHKDGSSGLNLLSHIEDTSSAEYRSLTREALAYAEWLKRYAAALIDRPESR